MATDASLTELALAAGAGDQRALEDFVRGSQRDVWRFVAHPASPSEADDLTQETYLRAIPALARFAAQSSARTWLLSIARRVVVDHIRRSYRRPRLTDGVDWEAAADRRATRGDRAGFEDIVELNILLDGIDIDRREALVLTGVLGMTYEEAARVCGCPIGTVRSRVARGREDLLGRSRRGEDRRFDSA